MINGLVTYGSSANPIKVHFKKHYCNKCGARLKVVKDRACISRTSPEAKYYYHLVYDDDGIGDYEFVHKIFCCPRCAHEIELITQLSLEDCDAVAGKLGKYCFKKGIKVTKIKEYFETRVGQTLKKRKTSKTFQVFGCKRLTMTIAYSITKLRYGVKNENRARIISIFPGLT